MNKIAIVLLAACACTTSVAHEEQSICTIEDCPEGVSLDDVRHHTDSYVVQTYGGVVDTPSYCTEIDPWGVYSCTVHIHVAGGFVTSYACNITVTVNGGTRTWSYSCAVEVGPHGIRAGEPSEQVSEEDSESLSCTIGQPGYRVCNPLAPGADLLCSGNCAIGSHCGACVWIPNIGRTGGHWEDENGGRTGCPQIGDPFPNPDGEPQWTRYFCQVTGF